MSDPTRAPRGRGRGTQKQAGPEAKSRQPGEQQGGPSQAQTGVFPRPQPPSARYPPPAQRPGVGGVGGAVAAAVPAPTAGRATHRKPQSTHAHPGDVDVQQRMQKLDLGDKFATLLILSDYSIECSTVTLNYKLISAL